MSVYRWAGLFKDILIFLTSFRHPVRALRFPAFWPPEFGYRFTSEPDLSKKVYTFPSKSLALRPLAFPTSRWSG